MNVLGDAFGAAIVAHLSRKELGSGATEMEEMDRVDQMDNKLDVEKSKLMEIVKFDEEHEEERTLLVTEDTKATVGDHLSPLSYIYIYMLNCKINGTVHIFFLKKSYLSTRCPKLPHFFFLVEYTRNIYMS